MEFDDLRAAARGWGSIVMLAGPFSLRAHNAAVWRKSEVTRPNTR